MHGTQYYLDIMKLYFYTTQETKISKSYINRKVKSSEVFTKFFLLGVSFNWKFALNMRYPSIMRFFNLNTII